MNADPEDPIANPISNVYCGVILKKGSGAINCDGLAGLIRGLSSTVASNAPDKRRQKEDEK